MKTLYVGNALSLAMLDFNSKSWSINVRGISVEQAKRLLASHRESGAEVVSAVGHADTAKLFSQILGEDIPCNRITLSFTGDVAKRGRRNAHESMLVGQYRGPRLPEGTTVLPKGATVDWLSVYLKAREV